MSVAELVEREARADGLYMDWRAWQLLKEVGQRHTTGGALMRQSVKGAVDQLGAQGVAAQIEDSIAHLRALPYQDYLRTFEWRQTRWFALLQARQHCRLCNSGERIEVHHRAYDRLGCEPLADLVALCHQCHARHEGVAA